MKDYNGGSKLYVDEEMVKARKRIKEPVPDRKTFVITGMNKL